MSVVRTGDALGASSGGHVFISHSREDVDYVRRLATYLRRHGVPVWVDDEIRTGERWQQVIQHMIDTCAAFVVVVTPAAAASDWVVREIVQAERTRRPICPLLLRGAPLFSLGHLQYEDIRARRMPSRAFVQRLREHLTAYRSSPMPLPAASDVVVAATAPVRIGRVPGLADCFQHRAAADRLDQAIALDGAVTQTLTGLSGVGKSQLAAEAAHRAVDRGELDLLVWVSGASTQAIVSGFAEAGIAILEADAANVTAAAAKFLNWLASTPWRWLVVIDDLAQPADLDEWGPSSTTTGRVVVTTRRTDAILSQHGHRRFPVDQFEPAEAKAYLAEKFRDERHRLLEADELAEDLGYLPLALAQAAAYIVDRDIDAAAYRRRLADQRRILDELAPEAGARPDAYEQTLAATVELAVDAADRLSPSGLARPMLVVLSLLDPNGVPIAALTSQAVREYLTTHRTTGASAAPVGVEDAGDALECLRRLSLTTPDVTNGEPPTVRVHAMVQRATRDRAQGDLDPAALVAADALVAIWPEIERELSYSALLRANTAALRRHAQTHLWRQGAHPVLFRAGQSFGETGLVAGAVTHFGRLATEAARVLGPDHADTLRARRQLAYWHGQTGDFAGAVAAGEELLTEYRRVLGDRYHDDPDAMIARSDLGLALGQSGDVSRAVATLEALLNDRLRMLGADHPETLRTRLNLTYWRGKGGDAGGAEADMATLLPDYLRVLGLEHRDTLHARMNLHYWQAEAGDAAGAATAFQTLLADYVRVLGPDHPFTLWVHNYLAYSLCKASQAGQAVTEFETLLTTCERVLSPGHPLIGTVRNNLAEAREDLARTGSPARA